MDEHGWTRIKIGNSKTRRKRGNEFQTKKNLETPHVVSCDFGKKELLFPVFADDGEHGVGVG